MVNLIYTVFVFLFGEPHEAMYTAATLTILNFFLCFFYKQTPPKTTREITKSFFEKLVAYVSFMIIANRLDRLVIGAIVNWEGPTQFLVCMFIVGREAKLILEYIRAKGINVPIILSARVGDVERLGNGNNPIAADDPDVLEAKMQELKEHMRIVEAMRGAPGTGVPSKETTTEDTKGGEG